MLPKLFCMLLITTFKIFLFQNSTTTTTTSTSSTCGLSIKSRNLTYTIVTDDNNGTQTGYPGGYRAFQSDSCPGYDWSSQTTPNTALQIFKLVKLALQPKLSMNKTYVGIKTETGATVSPSVKGSIGIAVNGVSLYGNADATSLDAFINEGATFDTCGGHPAPNGGDYHYHASPAQGCAFNDTTGQHSPVFGFMFDGIPIYGELGDNGIAPTNLDECGGHVDVSNPFYHYHLPKNKAFPYLVTCFKGCIFGKNGNGLTSVTLATCNLNTTQYNYSSINTPNYVTSYTPSAATTTTTNSTNSTNKSGGSSLSFSALFLVIMSLFFY